MVLKGIANLKFEINIEGEKVESFPISVAFIFCHIFTTTFLKRFIGVTVVFAAREGSRVISKGSDIYVDAIMYMSLLYFAELDQQMML